MSVEVTGDERDRKRQGQKIEMSELKRQATRGDSDAARALAARAQELDMTVLHKPDPHYAYRMANNEKKGRIGQLKGMGYEVVPPKDDTQAVRGYEQDGAQTVGTMTLMRTKRENYERRKADKRLIYEMQTGATMERAKENINKLARDGGFVGPNTDIAFDESGDS
jgi:hypothetical protein